MRETTIAKLHQLPEPLLQEVNDFIDFLLVKHDKTRWELWSQFAESETLTELDFADYLSNLEDYEDQLAQGEIEW